MFIHPSYLAFISGDIHFPYFNVTDVHQEEGVCFIISLHLPKARGILDELMSWKGAAMVLNSCRKGTLQRVKLGKMAHTSEEIWKTGCKLHGARSYLYCVLSAPGCQNMPKCLFDKISKMWTEKSKSQLSSVWSVPRMDYDFRVLCLGSCICRVVLVLCMVFLFRSR